MSIETENGDVLLSMRRICKTFSGVPALVDMSLEVQRGSVHALMGENGAGKSTLMKILIGLHHRNSGEIIFDGKPLDTSSISAVLRQGISMIYQELNSLDNMTVAENIYCGREPSLLGCIGANRRKMNTDTQQLLERLEISAIKPTDFVAKLSMAQKQLLEIAKAVSYNSKLIIMDEPTSAITEDECQRLFRIIESLKATGISFIYITHKMDELDAVADEVTVMRDGCYIGTRPAAELTREELIQMMVGRELSQIYPKEPIELGDVRLEVENLSARGVFTDVSFTARRGEILGVAGLMGAGRTEIMQALFGLRHVDSGTVKIDGKIANIRRPKDAISYRIAFLTEERKKDGGFLGLSVYFNTLMLSWVCRGPVVNDRASRNVCQDAIKNFGVKCTGPDQKMMYLSGGNQQKVLFARWLIPQPDIIILDEPTRGIDVGSKHEIYNEMIRLAKAGKTIIMISSELPEILGMSDRIMVVHDGRVAGILDSASAKQETILRYAAGIA